MPTADRARGTVVPFQRPRRSRAGRRAHGIDAYAATPAPWLDRLFEHHDLGLNAEWDRLLSLVVQAWCWRDPDSVGELEQCLEMLRRVVDRDWS
jgi:hypothetical protein